MKKAILASLFSTTLLLGSFGVTAFADEGVPTEPTDPTVVVPVDPPVEPVDPTTPVEPTEPTEPVEPTDPTTPVEPTEPTDPVEPTDPTTPGEPTEPTKPVEPTEPTTPVEPTEPTKPVEPSQPVAPVKPVPVVVTPNGEIAQGGNTNQQPTVPIETSNVNELTHVPTIHTPILTDGGESIVAVKDGVPLTQTNEGLKPIESAYKVLPSGNVEVKGQDGKTKVLPKTGETENTLLALAGSLMFGVSALGAFLKKRFSA